MSNDDWKAHRLELRRLRVAYLRLAVSLRRKRMAKATKVAAR